ncbi:MAG TPA: hypothetical protein VGI81_02365 [Tepidisphaeraceae bacterium]|jgi:hypothetical protein
MGIADVCQTLMGWRCLDVGVMDDPAGPIIAWEFVSRTGATRIRLLFAGGNLSAWHVLTAG